jgi:inosose dehydratase
VSITIGNAPTSWGIERPSDPTYPSWETVLDEVALSGYTGIELGPLGFFPTDPATLRDALDARGLQLSAGVLMEVLHDPSTTDEVVAKAEQIASLLEGLACTRLVTITSWTPGRMATAGRPTAAERLGKQEFATLCDTVHAIADVAGQRGVRVAFHPHAGTGIEFEDEVDHLLDSTDPTLVGLCVDTGHAAYARTDPIALLDRYGERVTHVHLKDVDPRVLVAVDAEALGFWEAYARGIFCPLGRGLVDFRAVAETLARVGYQGWATVEQDASPTGDSVPLEDARASRAHLRAVGLGD